MSETSTIKSRSFYQALALLSIHARLRASLAKLDEGEFTEGRELDRKWRVPHCPKTPRNAAAQIFNAIKFRVLDRD